MGIKKYHLNSSLKYHLNSFSKYHLNSSFKIDREVEFKPSISPANFLCGWLFYYLNNLTSLGCEWLVSVPWHLRPSAVNQKKLNMSDEKVYIQLFAQEA